MAKGVTVDIDWAKLQRRFTGNVEQAQQALDSQILADTEPFVPFDQGDLARSGIRSEPGFIKWDTPYARKQYYDLPNKSRARHPAATTYWFEAAKALHRRKWIALVKKLGGKR